MPSIFNVFTASKAHENSPNEVTSEMRRHANAIHFGGIEGQNLFGLAKSVGTETSAAAARVEAY